MAGRRCPPGCRCLRHRGVPPERRPPYGPKPPALSPRLRAYLLAFDVAVHAQIVEGDPERYHAARRVMARLFYGDDPPR